MTSAGTPDLCAQVSEMALTGEPDDVAKTWKIKAKKDTPETGQRARMTHASTSTDEQGDTGDSRPTLHPPTVGDDVS